MEPDQGSMPPPPPGYVPPGAEQAPPGMEAPPIQMQPMGGMPVPAGCPPGLEILTQLDSLVVKQEVELLEAFTGIETNNKYRVMSGQGQQVYYIMEETGCCERQICANNRGFVLHVLDPSNQEVMRIVRDLKLCAGGYPCFAAIDGCCSHDLRVEAPVGTVVGYVKQMCSGWKPRLALFDADNQMIGKLVGPCCVCKSPCFGDLEFPVFDPKNELTEIGKCSKKWAGLGQELFTDADTFAVFFPIDMDVRTKAVFLGTLMMLDFMYFEHGN